MGVRADRLPPYGQTDVAAAAPACCTALMVNQGQTLRNSPTTFAGLLATSGCVFAGPRKLPGRKSGWFTLPVWHLHLSAAIWCRQPDGAIPKLVVSQDEGHQAAHRFRIHPAHRLLSRPEIIEFTRTQGPFEGLAATLF